MMKALIKERPKDPIEFLIDQLTQPERKRIVIILPPGLKQNQEDTMNVALMLHNHLKEDLGITDIKYISVSDLLVREINKRSEYGKQIFESRKTYSYIKDEIVIDLVQNQIELCEKHNQGWILEGFPRTRMQALALQNMKIIPDKIFLLNMETNILNERLNNKLFMGVGAQFQTPEEMKIISRNAITEYHVNLKGVKDQYMGSITEVDSNKPEQQILEEFARILFLKESSAPRKPPKIILMGPPGVETRQYANAVATKYKLINLDLDQVCKDLVRRQGDNPNAAQLRELIKNGEPIPDDIAMDLLKQRLSMLDCKTNGWILQGAPTSDDQITLLKELDQQPNLFVTLEMSDNLIYEKLEQRRYDPVTNQFHFVLQENITEERILDRLVHRYADQHPQIKKKLLEYRAFKQLIDQEYSGALTRINAEQDDATIMKNFIQAVENTF